MKRGFTLIELLLAVAIFSVVIISLIAIFLVITRVQVRQSSLAEVNGQSQFLLQEMQYYIGQASLIDMPADAPSTTLTLRMPAAAVDPTVITLASGTLYLQQAQSGALQPLSSDKVTVSNLSFTKRSNIPARDSVSISFTVAYNTSNIQQFFSEMFQTSVARVSAATFDSSIYPSSTNQSLGGPGQLWNNINGLIYFNGNNVGVGPSYSSPNQTLDVAGGVRLNNQGAAQPPCVDSSQRGTMWFIEQAPALADALQICSESAGGAYQWTTAGGSSQWVNGANGLIYYNGGNVGIGTNAPGSLLTVATSSATAMVVQDGSGNSVVAVDTSVANTNSGIDITAGSAQTADLLDFYSSGGAVMASVDASGNISTNGNLNVGGTITAGVKDFVISDPANPGYDLYHSSLEGPEVAVFYRGEARLSAGKAIVALPGYFEKLVRPGGRTVLLTPEFATDAEPVSNLAASAVADGQFEVRALDKRNPSQKFYWEVKAVRADVPPLRVEVEK